MYFLGIVYETVEASYLIAKEREETFEGFADLKYTSGGYFEKYIDGDWTPKTRTCKALLAESTIHVPAPEDWRTLAADVKRYGIYNQNLQAIPPTGSILYINNSTSSIHPIVSKIEIRREGKIGRVYYPVPFMANESLDYYVDAYEVGPEKVVDIYTVVTRHVDQDLSLTLFYPDMVATRDIGKSYIYTWRKGIKTLYYMHLRQMVLEGAKAQDCASCVL